MALGYSPKILRGAKCKVIGVGIKYCRCTICEIIDRCAVTFVKFEITQFVKLKNSHQLVSPDK